MRMLASTPESVRVNQAPSGTLVRAEEIYRPSRQAIVSQGKKTIRGFSLHTIRLSTY
jgi:hypothetical protein